MNFCPKMTLHRKNLLDINDISDNFFYLNRITSYAFTFLGNNFFFVFFLDGITSFAFTFPENNYLFHKKKSFLSRDRNDIIDNVLCLNGITSYAFTSYSFISIKYINLSMKKIIPSKK